MKLVNQTNPVMKMILNITSSIILIIIGVLIYKTLYVWLLIPTGWYLIGLFSAMSHVDWTEDQPAQFDSKMTGLVWYTWYALSGIVLLFIIKCVEIEEEGKDTFP